MNNSIEAGSSYLVRRSSAFAIDVLFAVCIAISIPSLIAEVSGGRYRLTGAPGLVLTYCDPSSVHSRSTAEIIDRLTRSPPPGTAAPPKIEDCTTLLNLLARDTYVQISFPRTDRPASWGQYRVRTAFSGEAVQIVPLNSYVPLFEAAAILIFLASAWLDSPGMRLMGIRVRSVTGEKAGYAAFIARYGTLAIVFAPLLLPLGGMFMKVGAVCVAGAVLLLPWYSPERRGMHDVLAGTTVVRVV
jgi:uncharacterized RDD family membrane protein YckC